MTRALADVGIPLEKKNPVTSLLKNAATGEIRDDILDEKVMSAIVEIKVPASRAEEVVRLVWKVEKEVNTVVALGVGVRCDEDGNDDVVAPILERLGYRPQRAKTNAGLGRVNPAQADASMQAAVCGAAPEEDSGL